MVRRALLQLGGNIIHTNAPFKGRACYTFQVGLELKISLSAGITKYAPPYSLKHYS